MRASAFLASAVACAPIAANGGGRGTIFDSDSAGPSAGGGDPDLLVGLGNLVFVPTPGTLVGVGALTLAGVRRRR